MYRIIVLISLLLTACTTELWSRSYKDVWIDGFYVNPERNELIVSSMDSAYVFQIDENFSNTLLLTRKISFYPLFDDFSINDKNVITGNIILELNEKSPSKQLLSELKILGFKKDQHSNELRLVKHISGHRFSIEGKLPLEKLSREYVIRIYQPNTFIKTAGKIIATPAAIYIDGVLTVPGMLVIVATMAIAG